MDTYPIFQEDEPSVWLQNVPRFAMLCDSDWKDGHFHLLHKHEDIAEILIVYRGAGAYMLDHIRYFVQEGDVVLCNIGVAHEEVLEKGMDYAAVCLSIAALCLPALPPGHFLPPGQNPVFHAPAEYTKMHQLTREAVDCVRQREPFFREQCQGLMLAVLALTRKMVEGRTEQKTRAANPLCASVEDYIGAHYAEELTLDRIGRKFHISPWHLAHVFKEHTGYTLKQYLLRRRIGESQKLLMQSAEPVAHIAQKVGFMDAAHYSKLFTKYVGMSPTKYRVYRETSRRNP